MNAQELRDHAAALNGGMNLGLQPAQVATALNRAGWDAPRLKSALEVSGTAKAALLALADAIETKDAAPQGNSLDALIRSLAVDGLRSEISAVESRLRAELTQIAGKLTPRTAEIVVKLPTGPATNVGRQHAIFPRVLRSVAANVPVWLIGPAGSGKTTICRGIALALGIPFHPMSVGPQTPESRITGYMDAQGRYVGTCVYEAFVSGGLLLIDEIDAGNPGILTALNAIVEPGCSEWAFPDGITVKRHPDFRVIAAANTYGTGADRQYVGRQQLDAATLNRFVQIPMDYDEALERELAGNDDWVEEVQALRKRLRAHPDIRRIVSPRASIMGARLLAAGEKIADVRDGLLYAGWTADETTKVRP